MSEDPDWDTIHARLLQNPLLDPDATQIMRSDIFEKESTSVWKFDGSPDADIVGEVRFSSPYCRRNLY